MINLISPGNSRNQLYLSNYATISLRDEMANRRRGRCLATRSKRLQHASLVGFRPDCGSRDDRERCAASSAEQNVQVAAAAIGRPPVPAGEAFQYTLTTQGRLSDVSQFAEIIVKTGSDGRTVRLRNIVTDQRTGANGELLEIQRGAKSEDTSCSLDSQPSVGLAVFQLPGSNCARYSQTNSRARMEELKAGFPDDVDYKIVYDTTPFITESIAEVFKALRDALFLVAIVVLVFLQSWRAALIPSDMRCSSRNHRHLRRRWPVSALASTTSRSLAPAPAHRNWWSMMRSWLVEAIEASPGTWAARREAARKAMR
jgi:multidrug efflux pump